MTSWRQDIVLIQLFLQLHCEYQEILYLLAYVYMHISQQKNFMNTYYSTCFGIDSY